MGYLLKEALKSICGVNQWSYAVFWKIGCQNPKLLIWEDCYYEVMPGPVLPSNCKIGKQGLSLEELEKCWLSPEVYANQLGAHEGERVPLLINKMMVASQVHVVGEGLVGRTAFTGNHQWIGSGNFNEASLPPEVLNEVNLQFSAGMQTVAVIPAIPHGVIQLGSSLAIMENTGFIHDVKGLILHLGCVPGALVSDNFIGDTSVERYGMPFTEVASVSLDSSGDAKKFDSSAIFAGAIQTDSFQESQLANQISHSLSREAQNSWKHVASKLLIHNQNVLLSQWDKCQPSRKAEGDSSLALKRESGNKVLGAGVIPCKSDLLLNHEASNNPGPVSNCGQLLSHACDCSHNSLKKHVELDAGYGECTQHTSVASGSVVQSQIHNHFSEPCDGWTSGPGIQIVNFSNKKVVDGLSNVVNQPNNSAVPLGRSLRDYGMHKYNYLLDKHGEKDLYEGLNIALCKETHHKPFSDSSTDVNKMHDASEVPSCETALSEIKSSPGDDLFDVLGFDFKNKILNGNVCKFRGTTSPCMINQIEESQDMSSVLYPNCDRISSGGAFSPSGDDNLLDAVVYGVHSSTKQASDDNMSCRTTLTTAGCSSVPRSSTMFGQGNISEQICQLFGPSKSFARSTEIGVSFPKCALGKKDAGNCSQTSSFYGSHVTSWVEQGPIVKHETSIASANSKKSGEVGKPPRKRLKPGENPRPRPKDRQMIQDRVKELREIVPNGAKCSIDALLERTIKHMLFLQSVTKHADKLQQTVESKIISKDGGLLPRHNFEGGATWAYEVGSQGSVCPIVVENLNAPRQLLVEMLCEQRGFFLEIADIIRGMGLTILKGEMETRQDKIWARFAIEANRDVTRMEIFLSLVHLLEQTVKCNNNAPNDSSKTDKRFVHPTFDQAASVPGN